MATFFQSFRSSLMPKQLLRFALSRLDLLDAQALDLENLDFALGRNTVLEFRDVGLILQVPCLLVALPFLLDSPCGICSLTLSLTETGEAPRAAAKLLNPKSEGPCASGDHPRGLLCEPHHGRGRWG